MGQETISWREKVKNQAKPKTIQGRELKKKHNRAKICETENKYKIERIINITAGYIKQQIK